VARDAVRGAPLEHGERSSDVRADEIGSGVEAPVDVALCREVEDDVGARGQLALEAARSATSTLWKR